ncbi:Gamma-glutamyl phosphate reductase [Desulfovibrio sp. X2]|uniref:glutamate-5-semialdehyde dehydrogenase n=1 Tax=Desulfovibrio sp. X2 TaxID=941449 RepID=UPI0003588E58|nr:glutamate-5-semialdehyde dehydrogenase [Desulfovibrio sp. X2]EPR42793.1 Gamma-glutamyl phosphate reductase [Desulfovibrio sp. X2]
MDMQETMRSVAAGAREASRAMAGAGGAQKDAVLLATARLLDERRQALRAANAKDVEAARAGGMDAAKLDRLTLSDKVIDSMIQACREVAGQSDPVGEIEAMSKRPNGLLVGRMRVPLGVICMIYESRPNVTIDAAILCLKAGNAVILRGGSEAFNSNQALGAVLRDALAEQGLPPDVAQILATTDRAAVSHLLKLDEYIDVVIPRGGEGLIRAVVEQATMPVLKHYKGVCHLYVDRDADLDEALAITFNAKVQRPGVCNALECLLVNESEAEALLPRVGEKLGGAGVSFRACPASLPLLGKTAEPASPGDFGHEFHSLVLAVKVVPDMDAALDHIARNGSNHTEAICTRDHGRAMRFLREADASLVLVNASTRFNDGGELGLGAEIGISTSKLHAYGPMGVRELTATKFVAFGEGQVRG